MPHPFADFILRLLALVHVVFVFFGYSTFMLARSPNIYLLVLMKLLYILLVLNVCKDNTRLQTLTCTHKNTRNIQTPHKWPWVWTWKYYSCLHMPCILSTHAYTDYLAKIKSINSHFFGLILYFLEKLNSDKLRRLCLVYIWLYNHENSHWPDKCNLIWNIIILIINQKHMYWWNCYTYY